MRSGKFGFLGSFVGGMVDVDPFYANVVSLLHFDGPDGSTTLTDEKSRVWTPVGNAQIDTAQSKWGGASWLLDGSGDYASTPNATGLTLAGTDGTFEFWVRPSSVTGLKTFINKRPSSGAASEFAIGLTSGQVFANGWGAGGALAISLVGSTVLTINTWYFVQIIVSGSSWEIAINGASDGTGTASIPVAGNTQPIYLGRDPTTAGREYAGHMDDFRWTSGVARAISLPTGPFPNA